MKLFMTERRYRENIEMAIQNRERQEDVWMLKGKVEDLQYKVQRLENMVHDLESRLVVPDVPRVYWSDKTAPIEKTDITTCKGE